MAESPRITVEDAQRIIDGTGFGPWWGFRVHSLGNGIAEVRLPYQKHFDRPGGLLQGPCMMALSDVAFWFAAMTIIGEEPMTVTLEMKTQFLRGARGDLRCEARVLQAGKRIVYGEASCYDGSGKLVSHHTLTYMRRS